MRYFVVAIAPDGVEVGDRRRLADGTLAECAAVAVGDAVPAGGDFEVVPAGTMRRILEVVDALYCDPEVTKSMIRDIVPAKFGGNG